MRSVSFVYHSDACDQNGEYRALQYGGEIIVDNSDADHSPYAFFASNLNPPGGAILAVSPNLAINAQGIRAGQFATSGLTNGYGAYGIVLNAPNTGGFKYGLTASTGMFAESYAAALFGLSFTTDAIMVLSDARLKRDVKASTSALKSLRQLRPATYQYMETHPIVFLLAYNTGLSHKNWNRYFRNWLKT